MSGRGHKSRGHKNNRKKAPKNRTAKSDSNDIAVAVIRKFLTSLSECHNEFAGVIESFCVEVLDVLRGEELTVWLRSINKAIKASGIVDGTGNVTYQHAKSIVNPALTSFKRMFPKSGLDMCVVWEISTPDVRSTICEHLNIIYKTTSPAGAYRDSAMEEVKNTILGDLATTDPEQWEKFSTLIDDVTGNLGKNPGARDLQDVMGTLTDKIKNNELGVDQLFKLAKSVNGAVKREGNDTVNLPIPGFEGVNLESIIEQYDKDPSKLLETEYKEEEYQKILKGMENIGLD